VDDRWATKSEDVGLIVRAISFQNFQPRMWSWSTNVTDDEMPTRRPQEIRGKSNQLSLSFSEQRRGKHSSWPHFDEQARDSSPPVTISSTDRPANTCTVRWKRLPPLSWPQCCQMLTDFHNLYREIQQQAGARGWMQVHPPVFWVNKFLHRHYHCSRPNHQTKHAKHYNFHITKTIAPIPIKFCTTIKAIK